jgi:hypothetical protein
MSFHPPFQFGLSFALSSFNRAVVGEMKCSFFAAGIKLHVAWPDRLKQSFGIGRPREIFWIFLHDQIDGFDPVPRYFRNATFAPAWAVRGNVVNRVQ